MAVPHAYTSDTVAPTGSGGTFCDDGGSCTAGIIWIWEFSAGATAGDTNTSVGALAASNRESGSGNISIGINSMDEGTQGAGVGGPVSTVMVGDYAGDKITGGTNNTGIGYGVLRNAVNTANSNTCIGFSSGQNIIGGDSNTLIGSLSTALGNDSIAIGASAGSNNSGGDSNIYIGSSGPASISAESDTIRIGTEGVHTDSFIAGMLTVGPHPNQIHFPITNGGQENTVIGRNAMDGLTGSVATNRSMVVIGYAAYRNITSAFRDTVVGGRAGGNLVSGGANTLIGYEAGYGVASPTSNLTSTICIGDSCGVLLSNGTSGNILIGNSGAGTNVVNSGNNNIRIGSAFHFETRLYGQLYLDPGSSGGASSIEMEKPDLSTNIVTMTDNNTLSTQLGDQVTGSFTDLDVTPDVSSNSAVYIASYSSPTTLTSFDSLTEGQRFTIHTSGVNVSVGHFTEIQLSNSSVFNITSSNLKGNNSVDWSPASGDHLNATYNGTSWYCDVSEN